LKSPEDYPRVRSSEASLGERLTMGPSLEFQNKIFKVFPLVKYLETGSGCEIY